MKRLIAVLSLLAFACGSLSAAPVKTSKPVTLNESQMASVKGQGYFYVWVWVTPGYYNPTGNTLVSGTSDPDNPWSVTNGTTSTGGGAWISSGPGYYAVGAGSGPCSFDGFIYIGGPYSGQSKTH